MINGVYQQSKQQPGQPSISKERSVRGRPGQAAVSLSVSQKSVSGSARQDGAPAAVGAAAAVGRLRGQARHWQRCCRVVWLSACLSVCLDTAVRVLCVPGHLHVRPEGGCDTAEPAALMSGTLAQIQRQLLPDTRPERNMDDGAPRLRPAGPPRPPRHHPP